MTTFFSKSTINDTINQIKLPLGVPEIIQYERYLGLPSLVGRNKKASFNYIKDRVWKKLQGWKEKLLSQSGREILIKAVVQAIPTYTISCFKLPIGLCPEIESLIRKILVGTERRTKESSLGEMGYTLSSNKGRWNGFQGSCQFQ